MDLAHLNIPSPNWEYGAPYEPIDPGQFRRVIEAAALNYPRFTFVDFGSGKGRALLLASEYPFRKIVGVEFAPDLVEISRKNLCIAHDLAHRCREVEVVPLDAARFPIPAGPAVLFFHNPFEPEVMASVVENVRQSLESQPRELVMLYVFPFYEALWSRVSLLKKVHSGRDYLIYKANPQEQPCSANG
jgi:SAM-dependent methyltransferase